MVKPAHYRGSYHVRSRQVRQAAYRDPSTRCWRPECNRTLAEHGRKWTAGHVNDGEVGGLLLPECEECNKSRGAKMRNREEPQSKRWW